MYRPKTTLEQWRILQAVVDCGGYAHAAKELNKSQSSLNHAVAKLQDQLNVQLLEVKGRKAYLTPAGEVMLRRSRLLSQSAQELEVLAKNINQGWEPEIIIARDLVIPHEFLIPVLKEFKPQFRGSRIKIVDTVLSGSEEAIIEGWADIVFTVRVPKGYLSEPILEVNFVPVCHPNHPLATLPSPIDSEELQQFVQIVIKDTARNPREIGGWLKAEQRWTVSQFDTALQLVQEQVGFCWVPTHIAKPLLNDGSLIQLAIKGSSFRRATIAMVNPHPERMGPGTQLLTDMFLAKRDTNITNN